MDQKKHCKIEESSRNEGGEEEEVMEAPKAESVRLVSVSCTNVSASLCDSKS